MNSYGFGGSAPLSLIPMEPEVVVEAPLPVVVTDCPMPEAAPAVKPATKRKRAHEKDGTFKADDPATPERDEAYEEG